MESTGVKETGYIIEIIQKWDDKDVNQVVNNGIRQEETNARNKEESYKRYIIEE